jgi:hypothetical protein
MRSSKHHGFLMVRCNALLLRSGKTQGILAEAEEAGVDRGNLSRSRRKKVPPRACATCDLVHEQGIFTTAISAWCTQQEQAL